MPQTRRDHEKIGDTDEHVVQQRLDLFGLLKQVIAIGRQIRYRGDLQPALYPARHGCALLVPEVVFGIAVQQGHGVAPELTAPSVPVPDLTIATERS